MLNEILEYRVESIDGFTSDSFPSDLTKKGAFAPFFVTISLLSTLLSLLSISSTQQIQIIQQLR
jgi:hypothetical protein